MDTWSADESLWISVRVGVREATESVGLDLLGVGKDDFLGPFKLGLEPGEEGPLLGKESLESLVLEGAVQAVGALGRSGRYVVEDNLGLNDLLKMLGEVTLNLDERMDCGFFAAKGDEVAGFLGHG